MSTPNQNQVMVKRQRIIVIRVLIEITTVVNNDNHSYIELQP